MCQDFRLFEGFTVRFRSCQNVSVCSNLIFLGEKRGKCTVNSVQTSFTVHFSFFLQKDWVASYCKKTFLRSEKMGKLWHWVYEIWRTIKHFKTYLAIKCRHVVIIKCFHVLCWYRFDMNSKKILFLTQAAFVAGFKTHWIKSRYRDKH